MLSRGPGLPGYTSDVGNWTEPLGLVSPAVEAALFALAAVLLLRGTWSGWPALGQLAGREAGHERQGRAVQPGPAWSARSSSEPVAPVE